MRPVIIGLGHKARQGKDSSGQWLADNYGFRVMHFSDVLYAEARQVGWFSEKKNELASSVLARMRKLLEKEAATNILNPEMMEEALAWYHQSATSAMMSTDLSYLQWHGTEFRRAQNPNYWVDQLHQRVLDTIETNSQARIAICDMRFPNEFRYVKKDARESQQVAMETDELITTTIQLKRMDGGRQFISQDRSPDHPSETSLDSANYDFTIQHHTLNELYFQLEQVLQISGIKSLLVERVDTVST